MKILLAPDSFKESLSAQEVADSMEKGFKRVFPEAEFVKVPMADGGEGTTQSLVDAMGGKIFYPWVTGPLGEKVQAKLGIVANGQIAVMEMASASGLELVEKADRNPLKTTSYGTGELIKYALDKNVDTIIIGIGGSATNDGGAGMVQALGGSLLDKNAREIGLGGGALNELAKIDLSNLDTRIDNVKIEVACDVDNPLTGKEGASHVFGPQKGASPQMVLELDKNLENYARIIKEQLAKDVKDHPGAGAAGGLGAGLLVFLNASLLRGIDIVIKYSEIEKHMLGSDLVVTGEGSIDGQTRFGKTPYGVARIAKKLAIPLIAIGGQLSEDIDILYQYGFDAFFSILQKTTSLEDALKNASTNIEATCEAIGRTIELSKNLKL